MPREDFSRDISSATDGLEKLTQAKISATSTLGRSKGFGEAHSTETSSPRSTFVGDIVERDYKTSGRSLLPVRHKQAVGTSYTQPAVSPGQIVFEEQSQDKVHKVQVFSSQKMPQPFLDR